MVHWCKKRTGICVLMNTTSVAGHNGCAINLFARVRVARITRAASPHSNIQRRSALGRGQHCRSADLNAYTRTLFCVAMLQAELVFICIIC